MDSAGFGHDDVASSRVNDCQDFLSLGGGDPEFVEGLLQVVEKCRPFAGGDVQVDVRIAHRATGVFLRATCGPAELFGDQILESGP